MTAHNTPRGWLTPLDIACALDVWVDRLTILAGERPHHVPGSTRLNDFGEPFYQVHPDGRYSYEAWDRGSPCIQRYTRDVDELLYWIVDDMARQLAIAQASRAAEYKTIDDARRLWFPMWQGWIATLNPHWGARTQQYITDTLARFPYR